MIPALANKFERIRIVRFLSLFLIVCCGLIGLAAAEIELASEEKGTPKSDQIAIWRGAAEDGEAWAAFNLALSFQVGQGVPRNEREAVRWYRLAADKGYASAQANLGYCYEIGSGVAIDYGEAVRWYQKAAMQGHPYAQYNLGKKYQTGPGVATDPKLAEKWLTQAANRNFVPAYFSLGQLYANGVSGQKDTKKAFEWFRLAADQGYAAAQHAIGYLYFSGSAGQTNHFEAVKWFSLAASRNFADSHFNLAYCYERGLGAPQNLATAVSHYRAAAEFGHPSAQYSLGVAYYEGKGVQVDYVQAYKWWNLAAFSGIIEASSSKEILSGLMTKEQIQIAQKLAAELTPRKSETALDAPRLILASAVDVSQIKRVGSGFFISTNGYLFTTYRTVADAATIQVLTEGGRFDAKVEMSDPIVDIALLKISGQAGTLPLTSSRNSPVNSEILALGFNEENQGEFSPRSARAVITGSLGYQANPRQLSIKPRLTSPFAGTAAINLSGQIVGMLLLDVPESAPQSNDESSGTSQTYVLKSDHLITFLNTAPGVEPEVQPTVGPELSAAELMSRARAATALILVLGEASK